MSRAAATAMLQAQSPTRIARATAELLQGLERPAGALVFCSGTISGALEEIAAEVAKVAAGTPALVVSGAGVLSERGEIERQSAASIIAWTGGRPEVLACDGSGPDELGESLARQLGDRLGRRAPACLVFVGADGFGPGALEPLQEIRGAGHVFGAGCVGQPGQLAVDAEGHVLSGGAVAMLMHGMAPPLIRASHACRLLVPLSRITGTRGSMVVEIEGRPALDLLSEVGAELSDQPLVFAVLAEEEAAARQVGGRPELLVRGVQGVDPVRRGLMVSDEVREGMRMAFAVRDAAAARTDLEAVTRELSRETAGAAPRFALFIDCAGRGASLYGSFDVDTRILRQRFGDIPLAGMHSAFEIAPFGGKPTLQLYTGVLALFTAPS